MTLVGEQNCLCCQNFVKKLYLPSIFFPDAGNGKGGVKFDFTFIDWHTTTCCQAKIIKYPYLLPNIPRTFHPPNIRFVLSTAAKENGLFADVLLKIQQRIQFLSLKGN